MCEYALLIPVKLFNLAKQRLASLLDVRQRTCLSAALAQRVALSYESCDTFVVCDNSYTQGWATGIGVRSILADGSGMCPQISCAVGAVSEMGYRNIIIMHSDLPRIKNIFPYLEFLAEDEMVIVPDRRGSGTNVLKISAALPFQFHYGTDSFVLHKQEAEKRNIHYSVHNDRDLGFDIDLPEDIAELGNEELYILLDEGAKILEKLDSQRIH
ncbi:MAG: hypothetical protein M1374_07560 [Firmicutes bacterium]|jgi:2-phospho-L-lactate guanylyltransferase|nr:hypothetical protein [Bacillota bacterium]